MHVSQPALHTRIRKLEARLGTSLYVKHGRLLQLTEAGERLAAFANDSRDRAADFLGTLDAAPPRPLVLMAGSGTYLYLLGDPIRRFLRKGRELRLLTGDAPRPWRPSGRVRRMSASPRWASRRTTSTASCWRSSRRP